MNGNTAKPSLVSNKATIEPHAIFRQALASHQRGQFTQAKTLYEEVLKVHPEHFDALCMLGAIASQTNNPQIAVELMDKAIKINPNVAEVYSNRGVALKDLGQFEAALASYDKAIALRPNYYEAYSNRGNVFRILRQFNAALDDYNKAIALNPAYAEAYNNRGNALKDLKRFDAALESFDSAIALKADYAGAYNNRGNVLRDLKRFEAALASYDNAIALNPDHAGAHNNRGITLRILNLLDLALASFDKATALNPDYAEAYNNRGNILKDLGQFDAALASFDKAITINRDYAEAHWNKSLLLLSFGEFNRGWEEFEWRWRLNEFTSRKRNFNPPLWVGKESLTGKTILLHSEQGLGDAIQFSRYAKLVFDLGAHVVLEVEQSLLNLFKTLDGVSQLITSGSPIPSLDFHCPLLSLPLAFKTTIDSIPSSIPYLLSAPEKVSQWKLRLGAKKKPRVGLVWRGNARHINDHNRSITLMELLRCLPDNCQYISLQKETRREDEEILISRPDILNFGNGLNDFSDTAAVCGLMDVIVSVDTSVAHLAGALGRQVWILLPDVPDWRWLLNRSDSPWYPTAKLYRQDKIGNWNGVFEKVKSDLMRLPDSIPGSPED